jgi:hypothetical protein
MFAMVSPNAWSEGTPYFTIASRVALLLWPFSQAIADCTWSSIDGVSAAGALFFFGMVSVVETVVADDLLDR